jgi:molybdopterin-containing oxidoreductase family iron-sulfur binding subunit
MKNGMVIDLDKCIGCQTCAVVCKMHNSLAPGQWYNRVFTQGSEEHQAAVGTGSNLQMEFLPISCQMCSNAACEKVCPTQATYYDENGVVLVDYDKCIGCRYCMAACPYGVRQFNWSDPAEAKRAAAARAAVAIAGAEGAGGAGGSDSGASTSASTAADTPERTATIAAACSLGCPNDQREGSSHHLVYIQNRPRGVAEKCTFCAQYTQNDELPACARACPAKARIYGDLDDPTSEAAKLIATNNTMRLREDFGTEPKVYYITPSKKGA